jgi:hypothetical protein
MVAALRKLLPAAGSAFELAVHAAVEARRALAKPDRYRVTDPRHGKLSRAAYVAQALRAAGSDEARVRDLGRRLAAVPPSERRLVDEFLAGARDKVKNVCKDPPGTDGAWTLLGARARHADVVPVMVQAQEVVGAKVAELIALAVLQVVDTEGDDAFGEIEGSLAEHAAAQRGAQARYDDALQAVKASARPPTDLAYEWIDAGKSTARILYLWRGERTDVPFASPERLIEHVAARSAQLAPSSEA